MTETRRQENSQDHRGLGAPSRLLPKTAILVQFQLKPSIRVGQVDVGGIKGNDVALRVSHGRGFRVNNKLLADKDVPLLDCHEVSRCILTIFFSIKGFLTDLRERP